MTDEELTSLAAGFTRELRRVVPDWTDHNDSDPGVTLLQLFAFLGEQLLYRTPPPRAQRFIADAMRVLTTLQTSATAEGLVRNHYFEGKLLTADDLQVEQDYNRGTLRRHNRALHRAGIVTGLNVSIDATSTPDEPVVKVGAGYAIAPNGEELSLCSPIVCRLRATAAKGFVALEYAEQFLATTPDATALGLERPTRVQEGVRVDFTERVSPTAVVLATLTRHRGAWKATPSHNPKPLREA